MVYVQRFLNGLNGRAKGIWLDTELESYLERRYGVDTATGSNTVADPFADGIYFPMRY